MINQVPRWLANATRFVGLDTTLRPLYREYQRRFAEPVVRRVGGQEASFKRGYFPQHILETEGKLLQEMVATLEEDDIFLDIGANVGLFSCFALTCLPPTQVICFEPSPFPFSILRENLALNGGEAAYAIQAALGDTDGIRAFRIEENDPLQRASAFTDHADMKVPVLRGDTLFEVGNLPTPTVVKIDVEGAEKNVLEGMMGTLRSVRTLFIEVHKDPGRGEKDIHNILARSGFHVGEIARRGDQPFLHARRIQ